MGGKISALLYRPILGLVKLFSPKMKISGRENLPDGPCIIAGNHCQMYGPIACEVYFPEKHAIWCAGEMMHLREVPGYAYRDFWSKKPKYIRWFFKIASYVIAPIAVCVFNNASCIAVYHDERILTTFKDTMKALEEGRRVIIFPEHDPPHDHILSEFQDRFIDVARMYYRRTGTAIPFVPLYVAPMLSTMYFGEPVLFDPSAPLPDERKRICRTLMERITGIAVSLPEHTVVPYRNIPKKYYPKNLPREE